MNSTDGLMGNAQDHIMANTWRLIFDRKARRPSTLLPTTDPDFLLLEELLPEYRLIGLSLAEKDKPRRLN
ncbi:MAG: hypothetical protein Fur0044_45810 [Anaerolineae bacterium]|nr:hypothetical protein [Anaerolineales bacterium]MCQ3977250.1 hypothetical protein [Anaerolineae bacterium]